MSKVIEVNLKCLKYLYDIGNNDKRSLVEDKNFTIVIQESIIWCLNALHELIMTSTASKSSKKAPSKDQLKKENLVLIL